MNNAIFLMSESTTTALIVGGFGLAGTIIASLTTAIVANRSRDRIIERVIEGNEEVTALKKNTDGMQTALLDLTGRAAKAEGQIEGAATERDRPPLIIDPDEVTEALNGKDVREQIDKIEAAVNETQDKLAEQPAVRPAVRKQIDKIEQAVSEPENVAKK